CSSPPPPTGTNLLVNGGFETSISPWVMSGAGAFYVANGSYPQAGTGYAYLGNANSVTGQIYQQIAIPAGAAPRLSFYLNVASAETTTTTQYDKLFVEILNSSGTLLSTLATYSNLDKASAGVYSQKGPFNLAAYAGQTVRVQFRTTTDSSAITTFRLDTAAAQNSCSTITVTNPAINTGTAGTAFSQAFTQTGGSGTMTFSTTSALPAGLTLSSAGVLSGTPTQSGSFPITVKATDANSCSGTGATYTLTINCPTITLSGLTGGAVGTAYNQTVTATPAGGGYTFAVTAGALPAGLALNSATGAITGTPTTAGTSNFTITATGFGGCTKAQAYSLVICSVITVNPATLPGGTVGTAYANQTVTASPAGTYSYSIVSGALPTGLTLNASTGVISGTPTAGGTFTPTIRATGAGGCFGQRAYSISIACATVTVNPATLPGGTVGVVYPNQTITASPASTYTYSVVSGALPPGLTLNANTGVISGTPTAGGTFTPTIRATGLGGCNGQRTYTISIPCTTITVSPATLPGGTVGTVYPNQTITASPAGSYTFSVVSGTLPTGLTLNATTGVISGTPTAGGTFTPTIRATGAGGCTGQTAYTISIACATVTVNPATLPGGTVGTVYTNQTITASPSSTYTYSVVSGALPTGLTLNASTGVISGTPTAGGTFTPTIRATGLGGCNGQRAYTISIACPTVTINPATLPAAKSGTAYSQQLTANIAGTYSLQTGPLPTGLTLSSAGLISGTTSQIGSFSITVKLTAGTCTGTRAYTLTVGAAALAMRTALAQIADYDGDGKSDPALWSAQTGEWRIVLSGD
ncbi:MAG TPA: Ig domain-containing protein, partial [Blastocatellia bacterium]|nr:Ig domain-containing protein [Blastocatellia bacterium]